MLEIAGPAPRGVPGPRVIPAAAAAQERRTDCLIGEKLREQWMRE